MNKVLIKILQGSAVTQIVLCGLTTYPPVANFLYTCAKNYENRLRADKVIAVKTVCSFLGQTLNEWAAVKSTKLTFFYLSRCVSFTCDFL